MTTDELNLAVNHKHNRAVKPANQSVPMVHIDIKHAFLMIARVLDELGRSDHHHGHRVALIAYSCAKHLNMPIPKQINALLAGLIHDCGVASTTEHQSLMSQLNSESFYRHCKYGARQLQNISLLSPFAPIVAHHHTPYPELLKTNLSDDEKDIAGLIFLADRIDYMRCQLLAGGSFEQAVLHKEHIGELLTSSSGTVFHPKFVSAMISIIGTDAFWLDLGSDSVELEIMAILSHSEIGVSELTIEQVRQLALFIAKFVDAKCNFTFEHSIGVANVSKILAAILGLPDRNQQFIEIAGLLHDVGKLGTPDDILHKPGKLTDHEYAKIKLHVRNTHLLLHECFQEHPLVQWAANHHERLDGSGYPNSYRAEDLDIESKIMAMADIFQALSQDRPYRDALPVEDRIMIIHSQVEQGKLDQDVFTALKTMIYGKEHWCQLNLKRY